MDPVQESAALRLRQQHLLEVQNADGGWGYFARTGGQSWLEPTAYAVLALTRVNGAESAIRKGLDLVCRWQSADGSFQPNAAVKKPSWTTALAVTIAQLHGRAEVAGRGCRYLLGVHGVEADSWLAKTVSKLLPPVKLDRDPFLPGWPWQENSSSWIEPTVHSIVALRLAGGNQAGARERVDLGQRMILSLRCKDGGWNYGSRAALNVDLPSYPETTALALLGLRGLAAKDLPGPLESIRKLAANPQPPLARAWLNVSLAVHGLPVMPVDAELSSGGDVLITAIEALGAPGGNAGILGVNS